MIQPVLVPLQSSPPFQQIDTWTQLGVIHEFPNDRFNALVQIFSKDIQQDWAQH